MTKNIFLILCTFFSMNIFCQNAFEKGYFIDSSDQKIDCLIKKVDWKKNPQAYVYKLTTDSEEKNIEIQTIKEFGIYAESKYIKRTIAVDTSIALQNNKIKKPEYKNKELFLEVLVEGKATLYSYKTDKLSLFFIAVDSSQIKQLLSYTYSDINNKTVKVDLYNQQLWESLKCTKIDMKNVAKTKYKATSLAKLVIRYNKCANTDFTVFDTHKKEASVKFTIRPGVTLSSLELTNSVSDLEGGDFGKTTGLRLGIEIEYKLPFHKRRWSIVIEPTYQYLKTEKDVQLNSIPRKLELDYRSVEMPIGIRHYIFLNEKSALFVNGSYIIELDPKSKFDFDSGTDLGINSDNNFALGIGYKFKNKYSIELRHQTKQNISKIYSFWSTKFSTSSIVLGYTLY